MNPDRDHRLAELQAVIDSPAGTLSEEQVDEYLALRDAHLRDLRSKDAAKRAAAAAERAKQSQLDALRGKSRILHALKATRDGQK